jgi:hypothetical protein
MSPRAEKTIALLLLSALLIFFVIIALLSDGVYGGADNYTHFRLARYAFQYPHFFVDHWGKPVYTTLSSIFAQYGFNGAKTFNIITGLFSAYLIFRIAQKLKYAFPLLAIFMLLGMPMYFIVMISSLTEILFSFFIALSAWLFLEKKYYGFAVAASLLPFLRTEGFFLLPFFALALAMEKKYKAIPLLLSGTIFYSIVGSFHYGDLLWVFSQMPYVGGAENLYGSGPLMHFVNSYKEITGLLPAMLLAAGIVILIYQSLVRRAENNFLKYEWLLLFLPFFIYLSLHSWLWWQGRGSSLGLTRVMAGVLPLAALLCMKPVNFIYQKLPENKIVRMIPLAILIFFLAREPFIRNDVPIPMSAPEAMVKETSQWLRESEYFGKKIYYNDPLFCFYLDINPFDTERIREHVPDVEHPEKEISEGEIVLWDAHFSPNEGRLPLERMTESTYFVTVKKFEPSEKFQVLGGHDFIIYVFRRNDKK